MLKQRVLTAIVLLLVLLPALFAATASPFLALMLLMVAAGGWEWARLNGLSSAAGVLAGALLALAAGLAWWAGLSQQATPLLWLCAGAVWVLTIGLLLRAGAPGWAPLPRGLRLAGGWLALWLAWLALAQAREAGVNLLLSLFALVWCADIGAYFAGRSFGQKWVARKLAPAISPGKSWEGALGGALAVLLLGLLWAAWDRQAEPASLSLYSRLLAHGGVVYVLGLLFLVTVSVAGDLVESLVKRSAGVKDSSQLLPGHGGVLDRIDALIPVLPVAMMLLALLL